MLEDRTVWFTWSERKKQEFAKAWTGFWDDFFSKNWKQMKDSKQFIVRDDDVTAFKQLVMQLDPQNNLGSFHDIVTRSELIYLLQHPQQDKDLLDEVKTIMTLSDLDKCYFRWDENGQYYNVTIFDLNKIAKRIEQLKTKDDETFGDLLEEYQSKAQDQNETKIEL